LYVGLPIEYNLLEAPLETRKYPPMAKQREPTKWTVIWWPSCPCTKGVLTGQIPAGET